MNRTYKVIWSKARHCYVVVSELAKSHGKTSTKAQTTSGRKIVLASLAAAVLTFGSYGLADAAGWAATEGPGSKADGSASIAVGIGDQVVANKETNQGATAIAAGTLNVIDAAAGVGFDGVANSVIGQVNYTKNANAAIIFGAGNKVTNSYQPVAGLDEATVNKIMGYYQAGQMDKITELLQKAVPNSGGQVMVMGGGNTVDYAQASQVMGVSNALKGTKDAASTYNLVDGFQNNVTNAQHAYVVGTENKVDNSNNQVVFGDKNEITKRNDYNRNDNVTDITIGHGNKLSGNSNLDSYPWGSLTVIGNNNGNRGTNDPYGIVSGIVIGDNQNLVGIEQIKESIAIGSLSPEEKAEKDDRGRAKYTVGRDSTIIGYHAVNPTGESVVIGNKSQANSMYETVTGPRSIVETSNEESMSGKFASVYGAFNTVKSNGDKSDLTNDDGMGNSINGSLNVTSNAQGAMIMGAGNTVEHSQGAAYAVTIQGEGEGTTKDVWGSDLYFGGTYYLAGPGALNISYDDMRNAMHDYMLASGGAVSVLGNSNTADYAIRSQILGTGNTLNGAENSISAYNTISGFANTGSNVKRTAIVGTGNTVQNGEDNVVIGDYHQLDGGKHNVILGSMASKEQEVTKTTQSAWIKSVLPDGTVEYKVKEQVPVKANTANIENAVMLGYNTDVTENGGVAVGSDSIASTKAGVAGYDALKKTHAKSDKDYAAWNATDAAVSVGGADREIEYDVLDKDGKPETNEDGSKKTVKKTVKSTRQITNLAAGTDDTDAVNVAQLKNAQTRFYSVNSTDSTKGNYYNNGATGINAIAAGVGANTNIDNSIAMGTNAQTLHSGGTKDTTQMGTGDIAIGDNAHTNNYIDQGGSIAIGQNAFAENMTGVQESSFAFGQTKYNPVYKSDYYWGLVPYAYLPENPSKVPGGLAIGQNTYVRTGGLMVGTHNYKGKLGDVEVDSADTGKNAKSVFTTTLGTNSFNSGAFSTITGAYSIASSDYAGGNSTSAAGKNFGATIMGSLNSIESSTASSNYSGVANSIVGTANRTFNSNGSLIFGAGNEITNSVTTISAPSDGGVSAQALQKTLMQTVKDSNGGGATLAIGGGNKIDHAVRSQAIGVNNTLTGNLYHEDGLPSLDIPDVNEYSAQYNMVDGYNNNVANVNHAYVIGANNNIQGKTFTDATKDGVLSETDREKAKKDDNLIVIGDNHTLANDVSNNIILGTADKTLTTSVSNVVMIGYNADAKVDGGVALGADSIASTEAKKTGYDPQGKAHDAADADYAAWVSTDAAVSVGGADREVKYKDKEGKEKTRTVKSTRQITNVAAGTQDTDAVNVAQLKAVSSSINTDIAASKTHFYSVKSTDSTAKNYNNDGATGINALAAGVGANAEADHSIAIGTGAWTNEGDGRVKGSGDIAIGHNATIHNYVNQSGSIALGQNALIENTFGSTEKNYAFNQTTFTPYGSGFLPADANKEATGIAIGRNSFARTGSLMVGTHMYKGAIADMNEVDGTNSDTLLNRDFNNVNMTTLGTNSFNNGTFATVTGAYSATTAKKKIQNFAATIDGSLNSIESYKYQDKDAADNSGVASSIVGTANRIANSNNTTILGAGNEVTNSLTEITAPTEGDASAKALQDTLKGKLQQDAKGAVVVSGIGNKVDSSHGVSVLGSRNVVNTTDNIQLLGDNREVNKATGSVIIGSADSKMTTSVANATILGHNANVEKTGGVALGAGSVASREAGVAGYDPATKTDSTDSSATWKATDAAVSVGKADGTMTRQITGVAAGTQDTDAVNVAQLQKALSGAKDGNDTLKSDTNALTLNGNTLSMNVEDTAGHKVSGSVDLSKFAQAVDTNTTYTLSGQANQDNNTTTITLKDSNGREDSVTVATKDTDTRNTVKAGENVTLDTKDNADGSHEYTVHVKADGKVEAGSTKIVSGGTVYNETRVAKDGNFVKQSNTAGENLAALDNQVTANTESIYHMNGRISDLDNRVNKVGAGAAALAALHPLDFDPDDKWDFAVGYGNYRNANSVALGAFYRPNEDTMFSLGTNFGNGENMFNAGLSFKIGQGGSGITTSKTAMAKKIESLENTVDQQDKKIAELEALVKEQGEMIRQYVGKK